MSQATKYIVYQLNALYKAYELDRNNTRILADIRYLQGILKTEFNIQ